MPSPTFKLIASSTVGAGGASSISFSSIPSTYTDLKVVASVRSTNSSANIYWNYNTGTGTGYSTRRLLGNGASVGSNSQSGVNYFQADNAVNNSGTTANTFSNIEIYISNYSSTTTNKSASFDGVTENNATTAYADLVAALWADNSAITSINFSTDGSFVQYSTAYLYGIKNS